MVVRAFNEAGTPRGNLLLYTGFRRCLIRDRWLRLGVIADRYGQRGPPRHVRTGVQAECLLWVCRIVERIIGTEALLKNSGLACDERADQLGTASIAIGGEDR